MKVLNLKTKKGFFKEINKDLLDYIFNEWNFPKKIKADILEHNLAFCEVDNVDNLLEVYLITSNTPLINEEVVKLSDIIKIYEKEEN